MHSDARTRLSTPAHPRRLPVLAVLFAALLAVGACSSDNGAEDGSDEISMDQPKIQTIQKDGKIIKRYDIDGNGQADVIETIETYEDPNNEGVTKRRMVRKEVDVNADGKIDIVTVYDDRGKRKKETVDSNLDGVRDFVNFYDDENLVRKELYGSNGENVVAMRYYAEGELDRVTRDRNNDGKTDYWEYYEDGKLQRIGQDRNGDEKIDSWTHRPSKRTSSATVDAEGPDLEGGASGEEASDSE